MNKKYLAKLTFFGIICILGLSSCEFVNSYKTPQVDTKYLFRGKACTDTISIANMTWKEYFKDPFLQTLISEGLENNLDLQIAKQRIKEAEAQLGIARGAYFPDLSLVANLQQNRFSYYTPPTNNNNNNSATLKAAGDNNSSYSNYSSTLGYYTNNVGIGIAASWEADIWGKINRQQRAVYAQYLSSQSYKNLIQTSLISNIATTYYALLALDEELRITKQTLILLQENTQTMQALMNAGMLNRAAVNQSKGLLYNTKVSVPDMEYQIRELENSLCVLLGRKPKVIARTTLQKQNIPSELKYGVPIQMLAKRPDVRQAELAFRSAFEMTNAARASFYPSITLNTGTFVGVSGATFGNLFSPQNMIANIIGGITQPLFTRYKLVGQLKIAKAQQAEALLGFKQSILNASSEVSSIMYRYECSLRKNNDRIRQIIALATAVKDTKMLLEQGEANYTEVIDSERNLLQAQLSQVNDKLEQLQASVNLYRALGGGTK